jgi:hypothetical protein
MAARPGGGGLLRFHVLGRARDLTHWRFTDARECWRETLALLPPLDCQAKLNAITACSDPDERFNAALSQISHRSFSSCRLSSRDIQRERGRFFADNLHASVQDAVTWFQQRYKQQCCCDMRTPLSRGSFFAQLQSSNRAQAHASVTMPITPFP